jgi:D-arginine dehydrogenase
LDSQLLDSASAMRLVPALRPPSVACAVLDPDSHDIDVDALLQGYLRAAKSRGVEVVLGARVAELTRSGERWHVRTSDSQCWTTHLLVNAAGAWADAIAAMAKVAPIGIEPRRRSAFLFEGPEGMPTASWPAVIAIDESWYFKPDAGLLLGSPANADPVEAHDVVAEEFDVALGIHHIEQATSIQIRRPRSTWAGLRSFVADGEPVCGFDPEVPGFFWAAAVGGYGIQTSPAFGRLCAALIQGRDMPPEVAVLGLEPQDLSPARHGLRP